MIAIRHILLVRSRCVRILARGARGFPYRHEVLEARSKSWLGGVSLSQPLRWWVLTGVAASLGLAVVGLLYFGTYTERSRVGGELIAYPQRSGTAISDDPRMRIPSRSRVHRAATSSEGVA